MKTVFTMTYLQYYGYLTGICTNINTLYFIVYYTHKLLFVSEVANSTVFKFIAGTKGTYSFRHSTIRDFESIDSCRNNCVRKICYANGACTRCMRFQMTIFYLYIICMYL